MGVRDAGLAADTDYAGRSLKGQRTQAARLGAAARVLFYGRSALVELRDRAREEVPFDSVVDVVREAVGRGDDA